MNHRTAFSPKQKRLFIALTAALMLPGVAWGQVYVPRDKSLQEAFTASDYNIYLTSYFTINTKISFPAPAGGSPLTIFTIQEDPSRPAGALDILVQAGVGLDHFFEIPSYGRINFSGFSFVGSQLTDSAIVAVNFEGDINSVGFTGPTAPITSNGGAIRASGDYKGGISDSAFSSFKTSSNGGAIYVGRTFSGTLNQTSFERNSARMGGALYVEEFFSNGIQSGTFFGVANDVTSGNEALTNGGALYVGRDFSGGISGAEFHYNHTTSSATAMGEGGGALYVGGDFGGGIDNSTFSSNSTIGGSGGAVYVGETFRGGLNTVIFTNNTATNGKGGALYVANTNGVAGSTAFFGNIVNSTFSGSRSGGAVYIAGDFVGGVTGTGFTDNHTADKGGALSIDGNMGDPSGTSAAISGSTFGSPTNPADNNSAAISGGAVYVRDSLTGGIQDTKFYNSQAGTDGGALFIGGNFGTTTTPVILTNSTFAQNTADLNGGAMAVMGSFEADLSGSAFRDNTATNGLGGALYLADGGTLTAAGGDVLFTGNKASNVSNAIYVDQGDLNLAAGAGYTIDFQDAISGDVNDFVMNRGTGGTISFSKETSNISYTNGSLEGGTLILDEGAKLGARTNTGSFTQNAGTKMIINRSMTTPRSESIELNAGSLALGGDLEFYGKAFQGPMVSLHNMTILNTTATVMQLNSPKVSLSLPGNVVMLNPGEWINLIETNHANVNGAVDTLSQKIIVQAGAPVNMELDVLTDADGNLIARRPQTSIGGGGGSSQQPSITPAPGSQIYAQGYAAGMATLTGGADLVNDLGIDRALDAARLRPGVQAFGVLSGGKQRYITGSHISLTGYNVMAGVAYQQEMGFSALTFGGFLEYGLSHYRTTEFVTGTRYGGDGRADYVGGGLLGRWDFGEEGSHFYLEGLVRAGRVKVEFNTNDVNNVRSEYETTGNYYGANVGGGYLWVFDEKNSVNAYGKLMWLNQADEDTTLSTGNPLDFDAVNSIRARIGARYQYEFETKGPHVYVGLAYQHELDGKVKVVANDVVPLEEAEMKGGAVMGELGLVFADMFEKPLTFEFALQGYAGKREGVLGSFRVNYLF